MLNVSDARILSASRRHIESLHGHAGLRPPRGSGERARAIAASARGAPLADGGRACRRRRLATASGARWRSAASPGSRARPGASRTSRAPSERRSISRVCAPGRRLATIKINPDAPQLPVRRMALREGKVVYMAVPRLGASSASSSWTRRGLGKHALQAASIRGAERLGRPVGIETLPRIDLIVCGAVAVNARGARVGKGGGFSDLEYGLLAEAGRVGAADADRDDGPPGADPAGGDRDAAPRHRGRRGRDPRRPDHRFRPVVHRGPAGCTAMRWRPEKIAEVPVIERVLRRGA